MALSFLQDLKPCTESKQLARVLCESACVYVCCVCVLEKELDQISGFLFRAGHKLHSMKGNIIDSTSISTPRGRPGTRFLPTQAGGMTGPEEVPRDGPWPRRESTQPSGPLASPGPRGACQCLNSLLFALLGGHMMSLQVLQSGFD